MTELNPEVVALAQAIQAFVNASNDDSYLVTQALVAYEVVTIDEDGDTARHIAYSVPTENWALSGALGLAEAAKQLISRDAGFNRDDDDETE